MKRIIVAILIGFACLQARAEKPEFKFGLDWGFSTSIHRDYYQYYVTSFGAEMDSDSYFLLLGNGYVTANAGLYFGRRFCASIHSGYMAIYSDRHMFPVLARFSFFPQGYRSKGMYCFADGGVAFAGFKNTESAGVCAIGHLGGAYRIPLSSKSSLDFMVAARGAFDHPGIHDPYTHGYIPRSDVRKSDSNIYAIEFSVGLNF